MGGGSRHLKRLAAPVTFRIPRKGFKFAPKTIPGPHPMEDSVPAQIMLEYILNIAKTAREAKYILRKGYFKVDGKPIKEHRFPIGLMDVIELVPTREFFRVVPSRRYFIDLVKIDAEEAKIKPCRIKRKTMVKGGLIQMTAHDGRNFLFKPDEELAKLKPGDVLVYNLEEKSVADTIRFEKGNLGLIVKGSRMGCVGVIQEVVKPHPLRPRMARLLVDGETVETLFDYVFPIGRDKPVIRLHEEVVVGGGGGKEG